MIDVQNTEVAHYFSPTGVTFLAAALRERYEAAGNWPDDAIEVTKEEFDTFGARVNGRPEGMMLGAGDNGRPAWVARPLEAPEVRREKAIRLIDWNADRIRAADRSVGQYLDAEYQIVAQALATYRLNPAGEAPEAIQSYAAAEGLTVADAAQQIAEAAARADELLQAVRRIRLAGKAAIRDASDDADFMATARPFIDQLETLLSV